MPRRLLPRLAPTLVTTLTLALASAVQAAENVTEFFLDNGMQVVVIEDHRSPAVVHMVWYRAGAADEPPGQSGVAHFLEHLMFKGTDDLESGEFSDTVNANGGTDNAFTSWDYTGYFQRVAADRLGLMMEMEADRMRDLRFADEEVVTERSVILEERAERVDSSAGGPVQRTDARDALQQPPLRHPDHRLASRDGAARPRGADRVLRRALLAQQRRPDRRGRRHAR
jgi:predicted Zn-dependent peptidase